MIRSKFNNTKVPPKQFHIPVTLPVQTYLDSTWRKNVLLALRLSLPHTVLFRMCATPHSNLVEWTQSHYQWHLIKHLNAKFGMLDAATQRAIEDRWPRTDWPTRARKGRIRVMTNSKWVRLARTIGVPWSCKKTLRQRGREWRAEKDTQFPFSRIKLQKCCLLLTLAMWHLKHRGAIFAEQRKRWRWQGKKVTKTAFSLSTLWFQNPFPKLHLLPKRENA